VETAVSESFQLYKGVGLCLSILLVVVFQTCFPNRLALRDTCRNWSVNLPLALIDTVLLSLLCGACVCAWAVTVRHHGYGAFDAAALPYWLQVGTTVVILDVVAYAWHRANHRSPLLWRFHAVHHSDVLFDASTAFRFHPGELLISLGVRLILVTLTGLPLLGLIAFEVLYGFSNLFVHSDVRLGRVIERRLSWVFVTPSLHRLHHSESPELHNNNFGTIFSVWDRLSRTLRGADANSPVILGLPTQNERLLSLVEVLRLPLRPRRRRL